MSIHKSKGLEFPFVFLCDLSHRFNKNDAREQVFIHSGLGLGPKLTDSLRGIEYPTLARRAIEKQLEKEGLSEEMRVLYVAMTRAREQLIMTAAWKNAETGLGKLRDVVRSPMPPAQLRSAGSPVQWLASAALLAKNGEICIRVIAAEDIDGVVAEERSETPALPAASVDEKALEALRRSLDYRYPHAHAVELPTKVSATELSRVEESQPAEAAELVPSAWEFEFRRPNFASGAPAKLSAAAIGTATHSFLQYVELDKTGSISELESELERIEKAGLLSAEEARAIDCRKLLDFFRSETGQLLSRGKVYREFRFTLLCDAADCFGAEAAGEEVLLQGIIDCLVEEGDSLTIIDYKTDRVSAKTAPERAKHYAGQLRAYSGSAERIFGKRVRRRILHFLTPGVSVEI